jgi:hypothetical protein
MDDRSSDRQEDATDIQQLSLHHIVLLPIPRVSLMPVAPDRASQGLVGSSIGSSLVADHSDVNRAPSHHLFCDG